MKQVEIQKLTYEAFNKYGAFANLIDPDAPRLGAEPVEFFRDMAQQDMGNSTTASFSTCRVMKRDLKIVELEYHNHTGEGMLPLDGDVLLAFAPATQIGDLPEEQVDVFYVPQGVAVVIRPGVWHCAPYPAQKEHVNTLILLPERVYANDCHIVKLSEDILISK